MKKVLSMVALIIHTSFYLSLCQFLICPFQSIDVPGKWLRVCCTQQSFFCVVETLELYHCLCPHPQATKRRFNGTRWVEMIVRWWILAGKRISLRVLPNPHVFGLMTSLRITLRKFFPFHIIRVGKLSSEICFGSVVVVCFAVICVEVPRRPALRLMSTSIRLLIAHLQTLNPFYDNCVYVHPGYAQPISSGTQRVSKYLHLLRRIRCFGNYCVLQQSSSESKRQTNICLSVFYSHLKIAVRRNSSRSSESSSKDVNIYLPSVCRSLLVEHSQDGRTRNCRKTGLMFVDGQWVTGY